MPYLRKSLDQLYLLAAVLGASCIALICILMMWQTFGRQFGWNTGAINDIVLGFARRQRSLRWLMPSSMVTSYESPCF